ncbi:hypothetical protein HPB49_011964 [Dermacentor silvarum]|uniref:Uncharacterized protein n=1 Tax=Dermacentor silvarum TaxID=543639 RepID=A0ACB8CWV9_DERSI|nr:hypothetical protein HPB49_011964 [Dermacentor silvarum]
MSVLSCTTIVVDPVLIRAASVFWASGASTITHDLYAEPSPPPLPSSEMASASSQLNAVSHNRFTALATEDMDFFAVRGNDLHPSDIVGWKTSGRQVSQRLNKPQLNEVTQSSKPTSQFSEAQAKRMIARITKASRMLLNLPREEQKIVIRPRGGLCLARLEADIVMTTVITAANVSKTAAKADTICTNPTQNIIVISTPDEERARYYASVRSLYIGGRNYETHAYRTAPHGTVKGVIHHAARCKPRCKLCNGAHATGAEGCTNKYKVPFVVTQRRWERRNAGPTFSSQDFPQLPPQQQQQQNEAHLSKKRRSRSRKRDKSRERSASRGRSTDGKRSENMHVAHAKHNTVQSLRNENDQLKRCIAEQRAQMQEMNAKPPTPTENNTNSAMEVQAPVTTEANSAEPKTIDVAKTSEPAPKKRALEHIRERRVNTRLDSIEERQDRLEQTMKANYETLSQAIKATNGRLDATNARLDTLWFPAHAGELDAGPNRNEEADTEAHALTSRGSPSTHSSEPQRPDAEDEEYSITTYGDVLQWYRTSRRLYPPPHRDLQRSEAATLRQLQVQAIWTPYGQSTFARRHLLWDCAPPPGNQEAMPTAISSKIISREPGNQRDVVQHVLSILERQRPKAAPPRV